MSKILRTSLLAGTLLLSGNPATTWAQSGECVGDCDGNGRVTIVEIIRLVNIARGRALPDTCPALRSRGVVVVTITDLVTAVHNALRGCQFRPTPTSTMVQPSVTPTEVPTPPTPAETTPPPAEADILLESKVDSPDPVEPDGTLTYTITVRNGGPGAAQEVVVDDALPAGLTLVSVSSSQGGCSALPCELGTLAPGATAIVTLTATVGEQAGAEIVNTAEVEAAGDTNPANNSAGASTRVEEAPPPPPPAAPPVEPGVATSVLEASAFLYSGPNARQTGVAPGTIAPTRVAVLLGRVLDRAAGPIAGVTVTVLGHPELGETQTDAEGGYALAVNGGGELTLSFAKAGLIPVQRQVAAGWQAWEALPDVVMVAYDSVSTLVDFGGAKASWQHHQATVQTDTDGQRRATVVVPPGTTAELVLPDGSTQTLAQGRVRVTEFTVGDLGDEAMPAELPPTSAYTWAAEYSIDEAVAAGTTEVRFSQPVLSYVDNFLGFPVGARIPLGLYDRTTGQWQGAENSVVLRVVSETAGLADLDLDGERPGGDPDADPELYASFPDGERAKLAELFAPGDELTRIRLPRFSPWDVNAPFRSPPDSRPGPLPDPQPNGHGRGPERPGHGTIDAEDQVFEEDVGLVGVPFTLHYTSRRASGRRAEYELRVPITDASPPASLVSVRTELHVAGRVIRAEHPPTANQTVTIAWDGHDAFGRELEGTQPATLRLGYVYLPVYGESEGFAIPTEADRVLGVDGRREIVFWTQQEETLGVLSMKAAALGGWEPSIHHTYDPVGRTLHLGSGGVRSLETEDPTIDTIAGNGSFCASAPCDGDALGPTLGAPQYADAAPDGSVVVYDGQSRRLRRITPDGQIATIAGGGASTADGVPAIQTDLGMLRGIAVGRDGTVYFASGNRIRRLRPDGIVDTLGGATAACPSSTDPCGDGGPAGAALFNQPRGLSVAPDGAVIVADTTDRRVRRIDPGGTVQTILGTGLTCTGGAVCDEAPLRSAGQPASTYRIVEPQDTAVGPDGTVYVRSWRWVLAVYPDGIVGRVYGRTSGGSTADGELATDASSGVTTATAIDVAPDGALHVLTNDGGAIGPRVRRVGLTGWVTTVAAGGGAGFAGDGGPAKGVRLNGFTTEFAIDPAGRLIVADTQNRRLRRTESSLPIFDGDAIRIPSSDAAEVYLFERTGRHLSTRDALTGATLWTFGYDGAGRLTRIADRDGDETVIARDGTGRATSITSPDGDATALGYDGSGNLASVTNPASETTQLEYGPGGLLTAVTGPRGNRFSFTYDASGRLTRADDPAGTGGFVTFARAEGASGFTVTEATALGRTTLHALERLASGDRRRRTTDPAGLVTTTLDRPDGSTLTTLPGGTSLETTLGPDPRFGMLAPVAVESIVDTPGLAPRTTTRTRTATLATPGDPFSLQALTETETTNGKTATLAYDAAPRVVTLTSPAGRVATVGIDAKARAAQTQAPGEAPVAYSYNASGRLTRVEQGTGPDARVSTITFRANGTPETLTDPAGNATTLTFDLARRLTGSTLPEGGSAQLAYDPNGNPTGVTPPGRPEHGFAYTPVELGSTYTPPAIAGGGAANDSTTTAYDVDRLPTATTLPGAVGIGFAYDAAGRLETLTIPTGAYTVAYHLATGLPQTLAAPAGGGTITYATDGILPASETWAGTVAGSVSRTYDADYRLATRAVNGGNTVAYSYDADSLLTGLSGALAAALTREPATGRVSRLDHGDVRETLAYDPVFGELARRTVSLISSPATVLYDAGYTRDKLGRLATRTETIGGATTTTTYTYDGNGRLVSAVETGSTNSYAYAYDQNGNRLTGPGAVTYVSDAQDRLVSSSAGGGTTYAYTADGKLAEKSAGAQTTTYAYDALGNLRQVALPGGATVAYNVDGEGNRIERTDGTTTRRWLYDRAGRIVAELDGTNALVSLFAYATTLTTPDLMLKGGTAYRIVSDQVGSVRLVVEAASGAVVQQIDYDPFGRVLADTHPGFQPFGFAGGLHDPATGLVRFGARDYDPATGRWTAKDPIGFVGGYTNLYSYAGSDAVNGADPSGLGPGDNPYPYALGGFFGATIPVGLVAAGGKDLASPLAAPYFSSFGIVAPYIRGFTAYSATTNLASGASQILSGETGHGATDVATGAAQGVTLVGSIATDFGALELGAGAVAGFGASVIAAGAIMFAQHEIHAAIEGQPFLFDTTEGSGYFEAIHGLYAVPVSNNWGPAFSVGR